jgi:hypothetical protein
MDVGNNAAKMPVFTAPTDPSPAMKAAPDFTDSDAEPSMNTAQDLLVFWINRLLRRYEHELDRNRNYIGNFQGIVEQKPLWSGPRPWSSEVARTVSAPTHGLAESAHHVVENLIMIKRLRKLREDSSTGEDNVLYWRRKLSSLTHELGSNCELFVAMHSVDVKYGKTVKEYCRMPRKPNQNEQEKLIALKRE